MVSAQVTSETQSASSPWRGFTPGTWQSRVNVREFIQRNYTPYEGDDTFLQEAIERTQGLWQKLLSPKNAGRLSDIIHEIFYGGIISLTS